MREFIVWFIRSGFCAMENDVINGGSVLQYFAITAAWAGDKELALRQLERDSLCYRRYGTLKLLPFWVPLRGDPRLEQIVTSLAPKESAAAVNEPRKLLRQPMAAQCHPYDVTLSNHLLPKNFRGPLGLDVRRRYSL